MRSQADLRTAHIGADLDKAARHLARAAHDAQVACDSISLGDLDWARTNAIMPVRRPMPLRTSCAPVVDRLRA